MSALEDGLNMAANLRCMHDAEQWTWIRLLVGLVIVFSLWMVMLGAPQVYVPPIFGVAPPSPASSAAGDETPPGGGTGPR